MTDLVAARTSMIGEGLSAKTIVLYMGVLARADRWAAQHGADLDTIDAVGLSVLCASWPRTHSSRAQLHHALSAYWRLAGRDLDLLRAIRVPPAPPMRCRALEDTEASILAHAAEARGDRPGLAVLLGLYAALRRSEICALCWDDFGDDGWLTVQGKAERTRALPVHPILARALAPFRPVVSPRPVAAGRQGDGWLFPSPYGGHVTDHRIYLWTRAVALSAGLPAIPPHVLRHTALSTSNDATGDLRAVQSFAGHAKPETTAGYTRTSRRRLTAAVNAIDYGPA